MKTAAIVALVALSIFWIWAPSWYRLYYRIRHGRHYVIEDSGR